MTDCTIFLRYWIKSPTKARLSNPRKSTRAFWMSSSVQVKYLNIQVFIWSFKGEYAYHSSWSAGDQRCPGSVVLLQAPRRAWTEQYDLHRPSRASLCHVSDRYGSVAELQWQAYQAIQRGEDPTNPENPSAARQQLASRRHWGLDAPFLTKPHINKVIRVHGHKKPHEEPSIFLSKGLI